MIQIRKHRLWGTVRIALLAMTLVGVLSGGLCLHAASFQQSVTELGLTEIPGDRTTPSFRLADLEGRMVSLQDYQGKVVMLYFWATW
jgi:cytochrome oxidase Cu insertion factor (SCO1/SenC/PrrC family)